MTTSTVQDKIAALSEQAHNELEDTLQQNGLDLDGLARGTLVNWSLIPFKGGTLIGDCASHSTRPDLVKPDIQTSTVLFIDRREGGFAVTRNTFYDLVGEEVTIG